MGQEKRHKNGTTQRPTGSRSQSQSQSTQQRPAVARTFHDENAGRNHVNVAVSALPSSAAVGGAVRCNHAKTTTNNNEVDADRMPAMQLRVKTLAERNQVLTESLVGLDALCTAKGETIVAKNERTVLPDERIDLKDVAITNRNQLITTLLSQLANKDELIDGQDGLRLPDKNALGRSRSGGFRRWRRRCGPVAIPHLVSWRV